MIEAEGYYPVEGISSKYHLSIKRKTMDFLLRQEVGAETLGGRKRILGNGKR